MRCSPARLGYSGYARPAVEGQPSRCGFALLADVATLRVEREKLIKELTDAKRKFVVVAKKKQQEFAAR